MLRHVRTLRIKANLIRLICVVHVTMFWCADFAYNHGCVIGLNPESYEQRIRDSWIWKELYKVRNIRPSFNSSLGMYGGLLYTGTVWYLTQGREPWTFNMHSNKGSVLC